MMNDKVKVVAAVQVNEDIVIADCKAFLEDCFLTADKRYPSGINGYEILNKVVDTLRDNIAKIHITKKVCETLDGAGANSIFSVSDIATTETRGLYRCVFEFISTQDAMLFKLAHGGDA